MDAPDPRSEPAELTAAQRIAIALGTAAPPDPAPTTAPEGAAEEVPPETPA